MLVEEKVMSIYYNELMEYIKTIRPVSTHSHHLPDAAFNRDYCLKAILNSSYCDSLWCGVELEDTKESREHYISLLKNRNFFKCIEKALQQIYRLDVPLRADTYDLFDAAIKRSYNEGHDYHLKLLSGTAGYDRIILDAYWQPGDDNEHPELFAPAFRIDSFIIGFDPRFKARDDKNNARIYSQDDKDYVRLYGDRFSDFNSFFISMREIITDHVRKGAVALKCAIPYQRGLDIELVSEKQARNIFEKREIDRSDADIKAFQDYTFLQICQIAAERDIPFQLHTGLGRLHRTNAYLLQPVIEANPNTRFVLFHGSYPWMDDVLGLVHAYPNNVFPDIVWLPLISLEAAARMVSELIEVTNAHSICWGDDTWTAEESYGSLLAVRHVLATVLAEKVQKKYLSMSDAFELASNILRDNARRIYRI
jgi:hypothetical protein